MCFVIDRLAKPWRNRFVYKVVKIKHTGSWWAPIYPKRYKAGETLKLGTRALTSVSLTEPQSGRTFHKTLEGLYVFKTRAHARRYGIEQFGNRRHLRVIRLQVERKDFLYSACPIENKRSYKNMATYRKVKVIGKATRISNS